MSSDQLICPSARSQNGSSLIGVVGGNGIVDYLGKPWPIDRDFVDATEMSEAKGRHFRFAATCIEAKCVHFSNSRCGVSDAMLVHLAEQASLHTPKCGIRSQCRWFAQNGLQACKVCSLVITEVV